MDGTRTYGRHGVEFATGGLRGLPVSDPVGEVLMRRIILIIAFGLVVGSGAVVTAAQTDTQTESEEVGAPPSGCGTPTASPVASPSVVLIATPVASPMAEDPCVGAEDGTPES